jgi:hypothetical protein
MAGIARGWLERGECRNGYPNGILPVVKFFLATKCPAFPQTWGFCVQLVHRHEQRWSNSRNSVISYLGFLAFQPTGASGQLGKAVRHSLVNNGPWTRLGPFSPSRLINTLFSWTYSREDVDAGLLTQFIELGRNSLRDETPATIEPVYFL